MAKIRLLTQIELEGFAETVRDAEEGGDGTTVLSVAEIKARSMASKLALGKESPEYFDQYHRLLNAGVPWRIAAFVAWSSIPKNQRRPATQEEFAVQVLGLTSDRRIADWRKKHPIDQMIADLQGESLMQYRPSVFEAIGWGASQHDYKAAAQQRLFVELTRDMPNAKLDINTNKAAQDLSDLSDAELDAIDALSMRELLKKIRDDGKAQLEDLSDEELDAMDDKKAQSEDQKREKKLEENKIVDTPRNQTVPIDFITEAESLDFIKDYVEKRSEKDDK